MNTGKKVRNFFKGFVYALEGIFSCIKSERNMRFHIGAAILVLAFALICRTSRVQNCVLFLTVGLVMALECVNTAVEKTVDLICGGKKSPLAKLAKDAAAGAVLISAAAALGVGVCIFLSKDNIAKITVFFSGKPWTVAILGVYILLWIFFTLKTDNKNKKE